MDAEIEHRTRLVQGLVNLYEDQSLTDVILTTGERIIPCHKVVLAACSPYFKAMFSNQLLESVKGEAFIQDTDAETLSAIITYMYKGTVQLCHNNVQAIFTAANLFEMLDLCSQCACYMVSELDVCNCVDMFQFASFHNCDDLKTTSKAYIVGNFTTLSKTDSLLFLSYHDFKELIADDDLNVDSENEVFNLVMKWVETDLDERRKYLPFLFQLLRFPLMTKNFLMETVESSELAMSDELCVAMIELTKLYKSSKPCEEDVNKYSALCKEVTPTCFTNKPRLGMFNRTMFVFAGGHEKHSRAMTCYDPITKKNFYAIPLHVSFDFKYRIDYHKIVVTDHNEVFFIGGIFFEDHHFAVAGSALREVRYFDPMKKAWLLRSPLLSPRCAHTVIYHNGFIYAIGGKPTYPGGEPHSSVERYSVQEDEWGYTSPMPLRLCHHCSVLHQDKILVIGGSTLENVITKTFLEYNIPTDSWASVENTMSVPRAEFGAAILGNELYVIGGNSGQFKVRSVEVLNLETRRWCFRADFPEDRKSMATVSFGGYIYVCGGVRTLISRSNGLPRVVETKDLWKFDPEASKWTREAKLVQYANIHACVIAVMNTKCLHESDFISSG